MSSAVPRVIAETNRVEAFSDGVLAIAITLLVLDLHADETVGDVGHGIVRQWPGYLAYVATFLYVAVVWVNHHSLFTRIKQVDGGLLWANICLLLTASVLPFPTAELSFAMRSGTHGDKVSALLLYAVVGAAMSTSWLFIFTYLAKRPQLHADGVPAEFFRTERTRALLGMVVTPVPVVVGLFSPTAALLLLVATPVFYAATADGLRAGRSAAVRS